MTRTVDVHGGEPGQVMAAFPGLPAGEFVPGRRVHVRVIAIGPDEMTPLIVRKDLVGLELWPVFDYDQFVANGPKLAELVSPGVRICYMQEVIDALKASGKDDAAAALAQICSGELELYALEAGVYLEI